MAPPHFGAADWVASGVGLLGLVVGLRLAYLGRQSSIRWKRFIESLVIWVVTSLLVNLVILLSGRPPAPQVGAVIGLAAAVAGGLAARKWEGPLYGFVAGVGLAAIGLLFVAIFPVIELFWAGILLAAILFTAGYRLGMHYRAVVIILGTAIAGAQWVSSSIIGMVQVLRDKSAAFLLDRIWDFLAPLFGLLLSLKEAFTDSKEALLLTCGVGMLLVVGITGFRYQYRRIDQVSNERQRAWKQRLREAAWPWGVIGTLVLVAYVGLVGMLRLKWMV